MEYQLAVVNRAAVFRNDYRVTAHCVRGDTVAVEFDTEWNSVEQLVATFINRADGTHKTIEMAGTTSPVLIPWEVLRTQGEMHVVFIGWFDSGSKRLMTRTMDQPFIVEQTDAIDLVIPEATEDVLGRMLYLIDDTDAAIVSALAATSRAEAAAELIGTSTVTRAEFDTTVDILANAIANYIGRLWYVNGKIYVPEELGYVDQESEVMYLTGNYDSETQTFWIGEVG